MILTIELSGKQQAALKAQARAKGVSEAGFVQQVLEPVLMPGGRVQTKIVDDTKKKTLQAEIRQNVLAGSDLFTDALKSCEKLSEFQHEVVDDAVEYVRGEFHTNGMGNFWSLVNRGLSGTYVSVEPFHLFRYLDEEAFRYNNRKMNGRDRFDILVRQIGLR